MSYLVPASVYRAMSDSDCTKKQFNLQEASLSFYLISEMVSP